VRPRDAADGLESVLTSGGRVCTAPSASRLFPRRDKTRAGLKSDTLGTKKEALKHI